VQSRARNAESGKRYAGYRSRKVKILERAETMGEGYALRTAFGRRYARILDRVTLCYVRFGCLSWARSAATMIGFKQIEFFDHTPCFRGPLPVPSQLYSPDFRESLPSRLQGGTTVRDCWSPTGNSENSCLCSVADSGQPGARLEKCPHTDNPHKNSSIPVHAWRAKSGNSENGDGRTAPKAGVCYQAALRPRRVVLL
jgi:hypothetical protein